MRHAHWSIRRLPLSILSQKTLHDARILPNQALQIPLSFAPIDQRNFMAVSGLPGKQTFRSITNAKCTANFYLVMGFGSALNWQNCSKQLLPPTSVYFD